MQVVNVHEAKTRLSQLLTAVEAGEEVVIARQGKPVVRLVAVPPAGQPQPGSWRSFAGWEDYAFDPQVLAPLEGDEALAAEGWDV